MADYSTWPEKTLPVPSLLLDAANPRLPPGSSVNGQRNLIEELVKHDGVYELAKDIAKYGYIRTELLIGVEELGSTIVLEGNRRLAALKLLLNPSLAPEKDKRFVALAKAQPPDERVQEVRVLLAPSRRAAAPIILRKHTQEQVVKWGPLMQGKFYKSLVDGGLSAAQLADMYGVSPSKIRDFLRTDSMYEIACSLPLKPAVQEIVRNPREFPASVLERFLDNSKGREFLALNVGPQGEVSSNAKPGDFRKAYGRILSLIASGDLDSRKLNKVEDANKYIDGLADVAPKKQARSYAASELLGADAAPTKAPPPAPATKDRAPRVSAAVIPADLRCKLQDLRAREIFNELRRLKVKDAPNAHGILLRVLLEFGVNNYLTKTGGMAPLIAKIQKKHKAPRPRDWAPSLSQMIDELTQGTALVLHPLARRKLTQLRTQKHNLISMETLDGFVHNPHCLPDQRNLEALWSTLADVFRLVLQEPAPSPATSPTK